MGLLSLGKRDIWTQTHTGRWPGNKMADVGVMRLQAKENQQTSQSEERGKEEIVPPTLRGTSPQHPGTAGFVSKCKLKRHFLSPTSPHTLWMRLLLVLHVPSTSHATILTPRYKILVSCSWGQWNERRNKSYLSPHCSQSGWENRHTADKYITQSLTPGKYPCDTKKGH